MLLASIDVGSNSIRLLIAEVSASRLGLNRSSSIELAIRTAAKEIKHDCMPFELYE